MLDMEYSQKNDVNVSDYINMIGLKTSVLIAASLGIGALVAKVSEEDSATIYNFGYNLGLAFQLQDDLLDSFGNQEVLGKKIGNDILTNKRTFLVIKAFEKAKGNDLLSLQKYFSGEEFDPEEKVSMVLKIFKNLDIKKSTEEQVHHFYTKALSNMADLNSPKERKNVLLEFSASLMKRDK
jgi:geranylgeranyl diphosphate synthase type II